MKESTCLTFADVSLLSSEIGIVNFHISETKESKTAGEPLSNSSTPLHEPATTTSNPSSYSERQHKVISCPRLSWRYVKKYTKIVKLYTGCPTAATFDFIINRLRSKHGKIQYFQGNETEAKKKKKNSLAYQSHFNR